MQEDIAQRGLSTSILGDAQNLTGHGAELPAEAGPSLK